MLRESTRAGVPVLSLSVSKPRSTRFSVRPTERLAGSPRGQRLAADPDLTGHERTGGEDDGGGAELHTEEGAHAADVFVVADDEFGGHALADGEVGFALEAKAHLAGVLPLVRLRAERHTPRGRAWR